jgi:dipeptidyl aminopeptidase/acylaminoacyl peptidase
MMRFRLCFLLLLLVVSGVRSADLQRKHDITVDDYFTLGYVFETAVSPDGKYVAYTEGRWQKKTDDRKADLWITATKDGSVRRLTFDRGADHAIHWAPDSKSIYFISTHKREGEKRPPLDGKPQVWQINVDGDEPRAVTRVDGGVHMFDLASDGKSLYYVTESELETGDFQDLKDKFHDVEYGYGPNKVSELWRLDLVTWRSENVLDDKRVIREFSVSPDGKRVAMITTPDNTTITFEGKSRVDVLNLANSKLETIPDKLWRDDAPSPYAWLENVAWSGDSKTVAFNTIFDAYPAEIVLARDTGDAWSTSHVKRPDGVSIRGYGTPLVWSKNTLYFLGEEKARVALYGLALDGQGHSETPRPLVKGEFVVEGLTANSKGDVAILVNGTKHPPDIFVVESDKPRRLTNLNPQVDTWKIPEISTVSWKGANGDSVEGILELPPDYKNGTKIPLVVEIHGGPTTASKLQFQYSVLGRVLLPAKGYAVLSPNYRGSVGYGDKFITQLVGHENDIEVEDILKGVDALVERGIADPDRLGVTGWSNGGYLTNCLITKTTRFKAASSGAGIVDTVMEFGANDEPAYPIVFKQGFPWSKPDIYRKTSPTYALDKIQTPTLIHVGGADERCPPVQSRLLYRALKEYDHVPTELLVYPGEPHGIMKYSSRKAKMEWDLAWFEKYILGKK